MPFPLAAIPIAMQAGVGLYQLIKGQSDADQLKRPVYERPEEIKAQRRLAEQTAQEGLTGAAKNLYQEQAQRSAATGLRNLTSRQAGIQGLAGLTQGQTDVGMQMALADEERRRMNQQNLMTTLGQHAAYGDKEFSYNLAEPYQQKAKAAQALIGSGLQNLYGGLGAGVGALQQGQYLNTMQDIANKDRSALMDFLNKRGTAEASDLSGSGMYGGGVGAGAGVATSGLMGLGGSSAQVSASPYAGVPATGASSIVNTPTIQYPQFGQSPFITPSSSTQFTTTMGGAGLDNFAVPPASSTSDVSNLNTSIVPQTQFSYPQVGKDFYAPGNPLMGSIGLANSPAASTTAPTNNAINNNVDNYTGATSGGFGSGASAAMAFGEKKIPTQDDVVATGDQFNVFKKLNDAEQGKIQEMAGTSQLIAQDDPSLYFFPNFVEKYKILNQSNPEKAKELYDEVYQEYINKISNPWKKVRGTNEAANFKKTFPQIGSDILSIIAKY